MENNIKTLAYSLVVIISTGWLLYVGSGILQPLIFATLFAIFLYPVEKRIYSKVPIYAVSIPLTFVVVLLPLATVGFLFSIQFLRIVDSLPAIGDNLQKGLQYAVTSIEDLVPYLQIDSTKFLADNLNTLLNAPFSMVKNGLISSSTLLVGCLLTFIYTILILLYRSSLKNFIIFQFDRQDRPEIKETLLKIKSTVQAYVGGLGLVILLLSIFNSLGLWIIGIDYPIFWGALAGLLAIIPYIGTGLGGTLPFLYALATTDHSWQPLAVVIFYGLVQLLEGNLITPKIVGDKVDINPLVAIISLVFFGEFWGIGGVILALPIISIVRIILGHFDGTLPIAVLMGSDVASNAQKFKKIADH